MINYTFDSKYNSNHKPSILHSCKDNDALKRIQNAFNEWNKDSHQIIKWQLGHFNYKGCGSFPQIRVFIPIYNKKGNPKMNIPAFNC